MGEEVVQPFAYISLCQLAAAHKGVDDGSTLAASWLPTYSGTYPFSFPGLQSATCIFRPIPVHQFRWYPFSPLLIFSIVGKVNTFLKLSPFSPNLSDSRPLPSRPTTATLHFPPHQESKTIFPFQNCNTVSCKDCKNPRGYDVNDQSPWHSQGMSITSRLFSFPKTVIL